MPVTRAAILERLVQTGFVQHKGKQFLPIKDGINLAAALPEVPTRDLVKTYSSVSEGKQKLFQADRVAIGACPRCGETVYEGKKNYHCGNRVCQFVMWKKACSFEERKKVFTPKIVAALLKHGKMKIKGQFSPKSGRTYNGTVLLADTGDKYVNYPIEYRH